MGCFIRSLEEEFPRDMSFGIFLLKRLSRMRSTSHSLGRWRLNAAAGAVVKDRIVIFAGVRKGQIMAPKQAIGR
jgi:hypothetical protein